MTGVQTCALPIYIDLYSSTYANNGKSISFRTSLYQFIIYDKASEQKKDTKIELLRLEVRLTKAVKIKEVQELFCTNIDRTFNNLFSKDLSQKVIVYYWRKYVLSQGVGIFLTERTPLDTLKDILISDHNQSLKKLLYEFSLATLATTNQSELRTIVESMSSQISWYRFAKDLKKAKEKINSLLVRDWIDYLTNELFN